MNNDFNELYLAHWGIKGQKWGVRRFRNYDGTLTPGGKARYYDNGTEKRANELSDTELASDIKRLENEKRYNELSGKRVDNITREDTLVKIGLGAAASALVRVGAYSIKQISQGKKIDKKVATLSGLFGALTGAVGGAASVFGFQVSNNQLQEKKEK